MVFSKFILSTWHHNDFRKNEYIDSLWKDYNILTKEHFYHIGGQTKNRNPMIEAIITNYSVAKYHKKKTNIPKQLSLLEQSANYSLKV